jgi:hypothetical protein
MQAVVCTVEKEVEREDGSRPHVHMTLARLLHLLLSAGIAAIAQGQDRSELERIEETAASFGNSTMTYRISLANSLLEDSRAQAR